MRCTKLRPGALPHWPNHQPLDAGLEARPVCPRVSAVRGSVLAKAPGRVFQLSNILRRLAKVPDPQNFASRKEEERDASMVQTNIPLVHRRAPSGGHIHRLVACG